LLTSRSGLNTFPREEDGLLGFLPFPFFDLSPLFCDGDDDELAVSGRSIISPAALERRGKSWIVVVVVMVVIPDVIDAVSESLP